MTLKKVLGYVSFNYKKEPPNSKEKFIKNSVNNPDTNDIVAEITGISPDETIGNTRIIYLYDILVKNLPDVPVYKGDKILFRPIAEKEGLKSVEVTGFVKKPGIIKLKPGMTLVNALESAGGLDEKGYLRGLIFIRPSLAKDQEDALKETLINQRENYLEESNRQNFSNDMTKNSEITEAFLTQETQKSDIIKEKSKKKFGRIGLNINTDYMEELTYAENIELEDGDKIYIPPVPRHVLVMGEVLNPSAVAYSPEKNFKKYISEAGGLSESANKPKIIILKANGIAKKTSMLVSPRIDPGDTVIVPVKTSKPIEWIDLLKILAGICVNTLTATFILARI
jgi:protein involved in polysaccharide export with SLBB domain